MANQADKTQKRPRKREMNPNSLANLKLFEKGNKANLLGNYKGTKHRSTILRKWADVAADVINPITKEKQKGTVEDLAELAFIGKVLKGDVAAYKEFKDQLYGKITEESNVNHSGEVNIIHQQKYVDALQKRYDAKRQLAKDISGGE